MIKLLMAVALILATSLTSQCYAEGVKTIGDNISYQLIGDYSVDQLNQILTNGVKELSSLPVKYTPATNSVKLYRVTYKSVIPEQSNRPTTASGLIAIPNLKQRTFPVVSYQHGTVVAKTAVPSFPEQSIESLLMIAQFSGQGYIFVGADLFGKGLSPEPNGYMVKDSTVQACYDMLLASQAVLADMQIKTSKLFLSGWSQGSYSTMAFLNKLESVNYPVTATATCCTPNDLYSCMYNWIFNPFPAPDVNRLVGFAAILINSYEHYYGMQGLSNAAIKPQYLQATHDLYENKITADESLKLLPPTLKELLNTDFANQCLSGNTPFYQLLKSNQDYYWRHTTPIKAYYGLKDEVIIPYVSTLAVDYQKAVGGADAQAVSAGADADHRGTFVFGVGEEKKWFDSYLQ